MGLPCIQTVAVGQLQLEAKKLLCLMQHTEVLHGQLCSDGRASHHSPTAWTVPAWENGYWEGLIVIGEVDHPIWQRG